MGNYNWNYRSLGGVVRVCIEKGEDIAHLGELDQKLWSVLSCPVGGLKFDSKTLSLLDTDNDGRIKVSEIVAAAQWITSVIKDKDLIMKGDSVLPLSQIDVECEAGKKLYDSARQILSNLGLDKDEISVEEASDSVAIFADTKFNGDGIITPESTDDEDLKKVITDCIEKVGSSEDRSGKAGVSADNIEAFYAACAEYAEWMGAAEADSKAVFPYGDDTEAAFAACEGIKEKVADYFTRCKLLRFNADTAAAVDVAVTSIDEVGTCPLARPETDCVLPFGRINPAWEAAFAPVKALVLDKLFAGKDGITEDEWNTVLASFAAYSAWKGAKKGDAVESLGIDAVKAVLAADRKQALLDLVASDKALEAEANAIDDVCKLLHYYRDFAALLRNYVTFSDFYDRASGTRAVFEAGQLYIDQRCCDLCLKVEDMGKHADMAGLSGMFLIYCACTCKAKGASMNIVAVMTDGDTKNLRPGVNAIFYDRDGQDWEAVVTKIVDNPISIKQAFWSPYRKFANTLMERINKSAAEKESKVSGDMTAKANNMNIPSTPEQKDAAAAAAKPAAFDIAKFAGIFAAIGMAVAYLTTALAKIVSPWYNALILLGVVIVCISGPSMFLAWQKLRKRNLGPVLNANGWAINSKVLVNIMFGQTLTSMAKYPKLDFNQASDPFMEKTPMWKKVLRWVVTAVVMCAVVWVITIMFHLGPYAKYYDISVETNQENIEASKLVSGADTHKKDLRTYTVEVINQNGYIDPVTKDTIVFDCWEDVANKSVDGQRDSIIWKRQFQLNQDTVFKARFIVHKYAEPAPAEEAPAAVE